MATETDPLGGTGVLERPPTDREPGWDDDVPGDPEDPAAQEGGIGDLADEEPDEPEQPTLFGTAETLTASLGRKTVHSSHVKIKSRAEKIAGQYEEGEVLHLDVMVRVDHLSFPTVRDTDGAVTERKRVHHMTPMRVSRIDDIDRLTALRDIESDSPALAKIIALLDDAITEVGQ